MLFFLINCAYDKKIYLVTKIGWNTINIILGYGKQLVTDEISVSTSIRRLYLFDGIRKMKIKCETCQKKGINLKDKLFLKYILVCSTCSIKHQAYPIIRFVLFVLYMLLLVINGMNVIIEVNDLQKSTQNSIFGILIFNVFILLIIAGLHFIPLKQVKIKNNKLLDGISLFVSFLGIIYIIFFVYNL